MLARVVRGGAVLAACLGLAAALSGCTGGAGESRGADAAAASGPGALVDLDAVDLVAPGIEPSLPAAAGRPTEEGAIAFVQFWFDALNYALATNDDDLLASYTGGGCPQCNSWTLLVAQHRSEAAVQEGGLTAPLDLAVGPFSATEPVTFRATFVNTEATVTYPDGRSEQFGRLVSEGTLAVLWSEDSSRWIMTDVVLQS